MPVIGSPPNPLLLILINHVHAVVYLCFLAIMHRFEGNELISVKPVKAVPCAKPHETLLVLHDGHHSILAHAVLDGVMLNHIMLIRAEA